MVTIGRQRAVQMYGEATAPIAQPGHLKVGTTAVGDPMRDHHSVDDDL